MKQCNRIFVFVVLLTTMITVAGCKKKHMTPITGTEMAPVTTSAPIAQLTATPSTIASGDQVQLSWRTTDATDVSIDGLGAVPISGVRSVNPTESTTFHLIARGPGGTTEATARVTVGGKPNVETFSSNDIAGSEADFKAHVQDVFFDYDTYDIRNDAQSTLSADASYLASHPKINVVIGGYCDERGSNEYNLALGQNRADSTKNALVSAGVAASRIRVISYGKEKPFCMEANESCWQQNRRAGFTMDK